MKVINLTLPPSSYPHTSFTPIILSDAPKFNLLTELTFTREIGSNVTLLCDVTAYPAPTLMWTHNGEQLDTGNATKYISLRGGAELTILDIIPEDTGLYQCEATNRIGSSKGQTLQIILLSECVELSRSVLGVDYNHLEKCRILMCLKW